MVVSVLALLLGAISFIHLPIMEGLCLKATYFFLTAMAFVWTFSFARYLHSEKFDAQNFFRKHRSGIFVALILTAVIGTSVRPALRVLSDEANIASISRSMLTHKSVENIVEGLYYYDNFQLFPDRPHNIDSRPFLYPYLAHIAHTLSGYRVENLYATNLVLFFLMLFLIYLFLVRYLEKVWVYAAMIGVAAQPLVSQCVMSGGHDICSALTLVLCLFTLQKWMEEPDSTYRFQWFWFSSILVAHVRPESVILPVLVWICLFALGYFKKELVRKNMGTLFLAPMFLLPLLWQRMLVSNPFENGPTETPFSLANLFRHNFYFVMSCFDINFFFPYAQLLNILGIFGILYGIYFLLSKIFENSFSDKNTKNFILIASVLVISRWMILTSFYRGDILHPSHARYFVFVCILLSLSATVFARRILSKEKGPLFLLFSCFIFLMYNPISVEGRFSNMQILPREQVYTMDYLNKHATKNSLVIAGRPGNYVIYNYGSISFKLANANKRLIKKDIEKYMYGEVYVIQNISFKDGLPREDQRLDPEFKISPLVSLQENSDEYVRISKLISIEAPAKKQ